MLLKNLDKKLVDLGGKPLPTSEMMPVFSVGKTIASILSTSKQKNFDTYKSFILGQKFYDNTELEIDDADFDKLQKVLDQDATYVPLVLGQLIGEFKDQKGQYDLEKKEATDKLKADKEASKVIDINKSKEKT